MGDEDGGGERERRREERWQIERFKHALACRRGTTEVPIGREGWRQGGRQLERGQGAQRLPIIKTVRQMQGRPKPMLTALIRRHTPADAKRAPTHPH